VASMRKEIRLSTSLQQRRPSWREHAERLAGNSRLQFSRTITTDEPETASDCLTTLRTPLKRRGRSDFFKLTDTRLAGRLWLAMAAWKPLQVPRWKRTARYARGPHTTLPTFC
jgi:hypothetical protein